MGYWKGILSCEGDEAMAQVVFVILINYLEWWQTNNCYLVGCCVSENENGAV